VELRRVLEGLTESGHAFVRAWAYNGLGVLAAGNPDLRGEVEALFDEAAERETAAVRARIRHARAALDRRFVPARIPDDVARRR